MSKRDEFTTIISTLRAASPAITDKQRIGLLRQAVQNYELSVEEATEILKGLDLVVGEEVNYFEVLGLSIEAFQSLDEHVMVSRVETAHKESYSASLRAGARVRPDGKTEEQWRTILNQARDTLKNPKRRREYIAILKNRNDSVYTESTPSILDDMARIPAGEFQMGSNDENAYHDEQPVHTVFLEAFYMDKYPVTNEQYKTFVDENPAWCKPSVFRKFIGTKYHDHYYLHHWHKNDYPRERADHPVVHVSWHAAMAYARWADKRLPTEAEWEKAARGGLINKAYPWGDSVDPTKANYDWNAGGTTPVGKYPANGYGLYGMSGNIWEWCLDVYDPYFYVNSPRQNPISSLNTNINHATNDKSARVLRGGSWHIPAPFVRVANRNGEVPTFTLNVIGFRCARSLTS